MEYCDIGYYVALGMMALRIVLLGILGLGIMRCNPQKHKFHVQFKCEWSISGKVQHQNLQKKIRIYRKLP